MSLPDVVADAIGAVADAIRRVADGEVPCTKDHAAALLDLANAAAALKYGPQGYAGSVDYRYRQDTDYHYTTHDGDARPRPTGFGA